MEVKVYLPSTNFNTPPVGVLFPPETTIRDFVQELSKKFLLQGDERTLVVTPTFVSPGGVVDPKSCISSIKLDAEVCLVRCG